MSPHDPSTAPSTNISRAQSACTLAENTRWNRVADSSCLPVRSQLACAHPQIHQSTARHYPPCPSPRTDSHRAGEHLPRPDREDRAPYMAPARLRRPTDFPKDRRAHPPLQPHIATPIRVAAVFEPIAHRRACLRATPTLLACSPNQVEACHPSRHAENYDRPQACSWGFLQMKGTPRSSPDICPCRTISLASSWRGRAGVNSPMDIARPGQSNPTLRSPRPKP